MRGVKPAHDNFMRSAEVEKAPERGALSARCPNSRCKRHSRTVSPQVSRVPMADMAERFMSTRPRFSACVLDATPFEPVSHAASGCSYLMKSWVLMGPLLTPGAAVS
jgi:hypothetical protein